MIFNLEITLLRIEVSVIDDVTIMRADERAMSELLHDRLLERTHLERGKSREIFSSATLDRPALNE